MIVVAFDVGHTNLAVVKAKACTVGYTIDNVLHCSLNNLSKFRCTGLDCIFDKDDNTSAHKVMHFLETKGYDITNDADYIVIERQPLCGLTGIEQTLYAFLKLKYKTTKYISLISPNSLHAYYGMSTIRKERKLESIHMTEQYLCEFKQYKRSRKKDDMADACLYVKFFIEKHLQIDMHKNDPPNPFDKFRLIESDKY